MFTYISVGSEIADIHMLSLILPNRFSKWLYQCTKLPIVPHPHSHLMLSFLPYSPPSGYLLEYHCSFNLLFHDDWWSYAGPCSSWLLYNKSFQNSGIQVGLFWHKQRWRGLLCYHWAVNGVAVMLDGLEEDSVPLGGDETQFLAWLSLTPPRLALGGNGYTSTLCFSVFLCLFYI